MYLKLFSDEIVLRTYYLRILQNHIRNLSVMIKRESAIYLQSLLLRSSSFIKAAQVIAFAYIRI